MVQIPLSMYDIGQTETNKNIILSHPYFTVQWGLPTVSVEGVFGMMAGVLASAIESVGDYYACARLSGLRRGKHVF